jgi:hypothetical protein
MKIFDQQSYCFRKERKDGNMPLRKDFTNEYAVPGEEKDGLYRSAGTT